MYTSVLVPLDGSEAAAAAVPVGIELAKGFNARLVLLRVLPIDKGALTANGHSSQPVRDVRREQDSLRSQAEGYLASFRSSLSRRGVRIDCVVVQGEPAAVILDKAQALGQALLVITDHGKTPLRHRDALGSVSEAILRAAIVPVVLVKADRNTAIGHAS